MRRTGGTPHSPQQTGHEREAVVKTESAKAAVDFVSLSSLEGTLSQLSHS
jgi:hypothetical protein